MKIFLWCCLMMVLAPTALAEQVPLKRLSDQRLQVVNYVPHNVVKIRGAPFVATQIVFAKDEYIEDVQSGDLAAWTVSIDKHLPYMLFVKPTAQESRTNMTVVTNRHTYYFHLAVGQKNHLPVTYALQFSYPQQLKDQQAIASLVASRASQSQVSAFDHPNQYHWDYSFHGDRRIVPLHVFDDGRNTYLQLQPEQPVPAIFVVNNPQGREAVVNYRRRGQYLVIHQVVPQLTLRVGKYQEASIFNNRLIAQLRQAHHFW